MKTKNYENILTFMQQNLGYCRNYGLVLEMYKDWTFAFFFLPEGTKFFSTKVNNMAESLFYSLETITTLLIGHTPIQNKKFN